MVQQSKWNSLSFARMNDMAYISYPHLRFGLPAVPILPSSRITRSLAITHSTLHVEVLTMQYRTLVQQLYKYKQLDLSRVNIMRDIAGMIQEIFRNDPETSTSAAVTGSTRDKSVSNPYSIGISSINRLLENLWNSAELVNTTPVRGAPVQQAKGGKSAKSKADKVLGSGVETLRVECDTLKEVYGSAEQCTSSQVSYLKWASGGITPQYTYNTMVPTTATTNPNAASSSTSRPTTANAPPPAPSLIPPAPIKPNLEEENLGKFVFDSTNMMGELEEYVLELMDCGGMLYDELCDISVSIDRSLAGVGLTVEDIDEYCSVYRTGGSGSGSGSGADNYDVYSVGGGAATSSAASSASTSVNMFEYIDSASAIAPSDSGDILYRHIQQLYVAPVASSHAELANLRQLHDHTMRRTANACGKYCPFEIVWRPEKESIKTAAK